MLCHEKKFIFFHIPRTGGTSIAYSLRKLVSEHDKCILPGSPYDPYLIPSDISGHKKYIAREQFCKEHPDYFKFSFVRNPWDRFFSYYCAFIRKPERHSVWGDSPTPETFKRYILYHLKLREHDKSIFENQYEFICDRNKILQIDYIARFEKWEEEYNLIVKEILGIDNFEYSNINKSRASDLDFHEFYDEELKDIIEEYARVDIRLFNYRFY